jgi:hypothetical protein
MEDFFADLLPISYAFKLVKVEKEYTKHLEADKEVKSINFYVEPSPDWQGEVVTHLPLFYPTHVFTGLLTAEMYWLPSCSGSLIPATYPLTS